MLEETEGRGGDKGNIENRSRTEEEIGEMTREALVGWEEEWEERWKGERQALVVEELRHSCKNSVSRVLSEWIEGIEVFVGEFEGSEGSEGSESEWEERNKGEQGGDQGGAMASSVSEWEVQESIVRMIEVVHYVL